MSTCTASGCGRPVRVAIRTTTPRNAEGIVTTIYQRPEDAPKTASRYCRQHGVELAADLVRLSEEDNDA